MDSDQRAFAEKAITGTFMWTFKKGDNIILAAFGGGFTWGSIYLRWAY